MVRFLLCAVAILAIAAPCLTLAADGVLVKERVVNLPQDGSKWYVSLYGDKDDPTLGELERWFDSHVGLIDLARQTHYRTYHSDTTLFKERYAKDTPVLPAVKIQQANGVVVYKAAGDHIPYSPDALYTAMANATQNVIETGGVFRRPKRPVLPWRRKIEDELRNCNPQPIDDEPPQLDPPPAPIDDGGPPKLEIEPEPEPESAGLPAWAIVLMGVGSGLGGIAVGGVRILREVLSGD